MKFTIIIIARVFTPIINEFIYLLLSSQRVTYGEKLHIKFEDAKLIWHFNWLMWKYLMLFLKAQTESGDGKLLESWLIFF